MVHGVWIYFRFSRLFYTRTFCFLYLFLGRNCLYKLNQTKDMNIPYLYSEKRVHKNVYSVLFARLSKLRSMVFTN